MICKILFFEIDIDKLLIIFYVTIIKRGKKYGNFIVTDAEGKSL